MANVKATLGDKIAYAENQYDTLKNAAKNFLEKISENP